MKYVIVKSSRIYKGGAGYSGPTCTNASVPLGKIYDSKKEAQRDADLLTEYNLVGFVVEKYQDKE